METFRVQRDPKLGILGRKGFDGYTYYNILDPYFFKQIKQHVETLIEKGEKNNYIIHGTTFDFENKKNKLVFHKQNDRQQDVIFDLMYNKEYYHQTKDTIIDWADNVKRLTLSPIYYKFLKIIENLEPYASEPGKWLSYRTFINYLIPGKWLTTHFDTNAMLFDTPDNPAIDHRNARITSLTFYMYDHVENMGGEVWCIDDDFVYKPKANSAISVYGTRFLHGVTANMNPYPRLAFTTRIAHIDDLYLPGDPSKWMYKIDANDI